MADFREKSKSGNASDKGHGSESYQHPRQTGAAAGIVDQARETAQGAVNTVQEFAGQAGDKVQEWMANAPDYARQAGQRVQGLANEAYGYTADHMKDFGNEMTSMIRRYPVAAVAAGLFIGMLIGRSVRS